MLTGGKTAEQLYKHWARASALPLERMRLLFGDERSVPPDHGESNYALVMRTLLAKGVPPGCSIARMEAERPDREAAARAYEALLPKAIDVLLLGVGADGHVASLFPHSPAFQSKQRTVVPVTGPKAPRERLTITPQVIAGAGEVFVLATGREKGEVLAEALQSPADAVSLPVRLALGGTWLLDEQAACRLRST
jgi:6-phosphogluconolactonase